MQSDRWDQYASIMDDMPGMICRFQPQGIIEYVNHAYCRMMATEPEELIGKSFYQFLPEKTARKLRGQLNALTPESPVVTIEHPVLTPGGERRWQRWINRLLTDEDGRTIAYQAFGQDITEQALAVQKLQENEKLLRAIAENFPRSFLSVINPDLTIGFTHGQEFKRRQIDPNQFVGMQVQDSFRPYGEETVRTITAAYQRAFEGQTEPFELQIGEQIYHYEIVPIRNEQGDIEKILVVVTDITDTKKADADLRRSEARYRGIVEDLVELLIRYKADGTITITNDAYEEIFGVPGETLVGKNVFDYLDGPISSIIVQKIRRLTKENPVEIDEHPEELPDGRTIWLRWIDRGIFDENGRLVEIQGVGHDITNRREAEDRLRKNETQLHHIINTVPEGVILLAADETVLRTNPVAEKYLQTLAPGWQNGRLTHLGSRRLLDLLTSPPKGFWHEIKAENKTYEAILKPVENSVANAGWVVVMRDVTQEKQIQQRIRQQERLAAVGQLAAGIAHDFNNVMAVIILYVENILRTVKLPPRARERMFTINEQAQRAADLVQQILDFSRQSVLERQVLDLLPFITELVKLLKRTLPEHIQIELIDGGDLYLIQADAARIQQMMMNLAVNARDAMPDGGRLRIQLSRKETKDNLPMANRDMPSGDWVQIQVSDTGQGIHPDAMAHIYEPFFTTKQVGQGTGLGLAQVYGIVQQHDGYIDVESKQGRGTTFTLYFPAIIPLEGWGNVPINMNLRQGQGQTILVVEDNPVTRQALLDALEMLQYKVLEATNGRDAMRILDTHHPQIDLIISDVVMPEMGGVALVHAIRDKNITIPVIFLSGHPLGQELEDLPPLGLAGWMLKPPNLINFSNLIAQVLHP